MTIRTETKRPTLPLAALLAALLLAGVAAADQHHDPVEADHAADQATEHVADAAHADAQTDDHAEGAHAGEHGDEHAEGEHDRFHLPNFVSIGFGVHGGWLDPIFSAIVALLITLTLTSVAARRTDMPTRFQAAIEILMSGLDKQVQAVIGPLGRRYTPYLGTLFIFIWINNLIGLVPFFHASTSSINTTAALAVCTFLYVQYIGLTKNGILGYLHHMAGSPRSGVEWAFVPLMFPLHLLGEFIKPLSLSVRLYGNVFGEDKLIAVFVVLGAGMLAFTHAPIGIPVQVPIVFLALLTSTIQALVFTLLSMVYIALMLPHDDHGEAHGH